MSTIKLYLPYGALGSVNRRGEDRYRPRTETTYHWFVAERKEPIAPYASLIMNHRSLRETVREDAERMVDEFLSEGEFHQLRDYLQSAHGQDIRTAVLCAPIVAIRPDVQTRAGASRPFLRSSVPTSDSLPEPGTGPAQEPEAESGEEESRKPHQEEVGALYRLSEEEGYSLPFSVWGYYKAASPIKAVTDVSSRREFAWQPKTLPSQGRVSSFRAR